MKIFFFLVCFSIVQADDFNLDAIFTEKEKKIEKKSIELKKFSKDSKKSAKSAQEDFHNRYEYISSGSSNVSSIIVSAECVAAICIVKNFHLSNGSGRGFISDMYNSVSIHNNGSGIAGSYSYSLKLPNSNGYCSGTVSISGRKKRVIINVYENCNSAGVNEF